MKKILIIDDSMFMRMSLKATLEKNGYNVIGEAENGRIGVEKYKVLHPDIVTMDITMPDLDGLSAVKEIIKFDSAAKIVMVSAVGQESNVMKAVMNGAKTFIVKPFKEDYLMKVLEKL